MTQWNHPLTHVLLRFEEANAESIGVEKLMCEWTQILHNLNNLLNNQTAQQFL
jgi:hypothetical protein